MKFNVFINNETIHQAASLVSEHYRDDGFLDMIVSHGKFNLTDDSSLKIAQRIVGGYDLVMNVKSYKTFNPFSKVIGYAKGNTIYCNTRKLNLPLKDRTQNFMHEPLHLLGYSHEGNTNNEFNRGTVPYKVAEIFVAYLEKIGKLHLL